MASLSALSGQYQKTQLPNGLRVISEAVPHVRSVSLGVWIHVGSRDEQEKEQGISHFLEHMVFKGTETRSTFEIAHSLESLGGGLDAFTSRDLTCYYARCLDEHLNVALEVLADMLQNSVFDPEEIEKEKRVVLEEIQTVEDTPDDLIHDLFAQSVWGKHPVGAPIMGSPETVRAFSQEKLVDHLGVHYQPNRIVITASGNLSHQHLVELVNQWFHYTSDTSQPLNRKQPQDTERDQRHYTREIGQTHICLGTTACSYAHPKRYEHLIANTALGEGMSSRLFQQIRERLGLAYSVYSYLETLEDTGLFGIYMACDSARVEQAVEIAYAEIQKLKCEALSKEELASAKAQLRGELILGQESMDNRMGRLAQHEIYAQGYRPIEDSIGGIESVTQESVLDACDALIDLGKMHRITVGP